MPLARDGGQVRYLNGDRKLRLAKIWASKLELRVIRLQLNDPVPQLMIASIKLPLSFDPSLLKLDLVRIAPDDWVRHFNQKYYEGEWAGVALRSSGGDTTQIYPDPVAKEPVADTPILARCPNISAALEVFECQIKSARLLRLAAGSAIREHRDYNLGYEDGEVRLHIPIITNGAVEFLLEGARIEMNEGECWYLDFNLPHRVNNRGSDDRVHLVLDCDLNEWLKELLSCGETAMLQSASIPDDPLCRGGWQEFHETVLNDPALQSRLRVTDDRQAFVKIAVGIGRETGYHFAATEVEEAMDLARRVWIERWVE